MINKVYELLKNIGVPLDHNFRPDLNAKNNMVISYHFFNEGGLQFGDGNINEYGGGLQVDLFVKHRIDFLDTKKKIVDILTKNYFMLVGITTAQEEIEGIGKIDHLKFVFNYLEMEDKQE